MPTLPTLDDKTNEAQAGNALRMEEIRSLGREYLAIIAALIEKQGGKVEISQEDLQAASESSSKIEFYYEDGKIILRIADDSKAVV